MSAVKDGLKWYAVHTRSNFEDHIIGDLAARGLEGYCPAHDEIHQWKDRKKKISVPLFPGYVFVRFIDVPATRSVVTRTRGVARILGAAGSIEPVPEREIEAVRRLVTARVGSYAIPLVKEGEWVRVCRGPLQGLEGTLIRVKNQSRLAVSVTLLSRSVAAEVDIRDVAAVPEAGGSKCIRI